ncbi:hypothetical protein EIP86_010026 [Pleurotus ostreatoroseus]|nr:hypothetical protein EIP86_010026 [Pleurotus ostreatoroseus]
MTQHPVSDSRAKRGNAHADTGETHKRHKSTSSTAPDDADSTTERVVIDEDSKAKPALLKGKGGSTRKTRQNGGAVATPETEETLTTTQSPSEVADSVKDGSGPKISGGIKDTPAEVGDTSAEAKNAADTLTETENAANAVSTEAKDVANAPDTEAKDVANASTAEAKDAAKDTKDAPKDILTEVKGTSKEINDLGWIPVSVLRVNPEKGRHAIAEIPTDKVTWGGYANTFMCYKGRVVTAVFVGRVISTWFRNSDNTLPSCPSLKFKFLRDLDETAARALVYEKARPARVTSKKTFWAGKRCSTLDVFTKEWQPFAFSDIYDGTKKVLKHVDMDALESSRIHNNDLVMLECQINRFVPDQRKPVFTSARVWETRFRLMSVVKLYEPKGIKRDEESSEESEVREDSDEEMVGF